MERTQEGGGVFCFPQVDACNSDEEVANFQHSQENTAVAGSEVGSLPVVEAAKVANSGGGVQSEQCMTNSGEITLNPWQTRAGARWKRKTDAGTQKPEVT